MCGGRCLEKRQSVECESVALAVLVKEAGQLLISISNSARDTLGKDKGKGLSGLRCHMKGRVSSN
jgi:hypothetical protein